MAKIMTICLLKRRDLQLKLGSYVHAKLDFRDAESPYESIATTGSLQNLAVEPSGAPESCACDDNRSYLPMSAMLL